MIFSFDHARSILTIFVLDRVAQCQICSPNILSDILIISLILDPKAMKVQLSARFCALSSCAVIMYVFVLVLLLTAALSSCTFHKPKFWTGVYLVVIASVGFLFRIDGFYLMANYQMIINQKTASV